MLLIPKKLIPIITKVNDFRYFLLTGGRGGAKSQSVGRFILHLGEMRRMRIVCGREVQNSINESVYSLLADLIKEFNLNYDVMATKITHRKTKTTINFRGFREQGAFNIQGMEGVDVLHIDEAQAITKGTLDVLIPTIRKDKAKIFFSMNRHIVDDPVYKTFHARLDCLHININYDENEYCTKALKKEAEECRKISEEDYQHIWKGIPLAQSEDAVYSVEDFLVEPVEICKGYGEKVAGFDIARYGDDKCAVVILRQLDELHWEEYFVDEWGLKDLNYTTGRILDITTSHNVKYAVIDEDGIGAGPLDTLNKGRELKQFIGFRNPPIGYQDNKSYCNQRTVCAYKVKEMFLKGYLRIKHDRLKDELLTIRYEFDNYQRKRLVSKQKMRQRRIKSPNIADALIMSVEGRKRVVRPKTDYQRNFNNKPSGYGWNLRERVHY